MRINTILGDYEKEVIKAIKEVSDKFHFSVGITLPSLKGTPKVYMYKKEYYIFVAFDVRMSGRIILDPSVGKAMMKLQEEKEKQDDRET